MVSKCSCAGELRRGRVVAVTRRVSSQLTAAGFDLHADVWEGGAGDPVLLLHGLGGNSVTWHGVAPLLARGLGARVLAVDLPGFGVSHPRGKPCGYTVLFEVVAAILAEQAPSGALWHVAGNSLGGLLALQAAATFPERIARVTLSALSLPLAWGRSWREFLALKSYVPTAIPRLGRSLVGRYMNALGLPGVVDEPIRFLFGDPSRLDPDLRRRLLDVSGYRLTWTDEAARALEETTRGLGVALLRRDRAERWIRATRCPVRAIYGSRDPLYPPRAWQYLERVRPDWEYVCMEGVGHVPQLEVPVEFVDHVLKA
jgi:pimeloyl-ACP methyl ester carboxylesterase